MKKNISRQGENAWSGYYVVIGANVKKDLLAAGTVDPNAKKIREAWGRKIGERFAEAIAPFLCAWLSLIQLQPGNR